MKLRFSIRDLLWLTLVCAVLVAWWMDRRWLDHKLEMVDAHVRYIERVEVRWRKSGNRRVTPEKESQFWRDLDQGVSESK